MAQLTWREMAAPDLSGALRGTSQFTDILNQTLNNVRGTVNEIDSGITDRNNAAALRIAAAVQDPEQAKALLANEAIMGNTRLTAPTIAALASRPGQLIAQATGEQNLSDLKYTSDQVRAGDALSGVVSQAGALRRAGKLNEANALVEANREGFARAGLKTSMAINEALDRDEMFGLDVTGKKLGFEETRLGMDRTRQDMSQSATRFNWEVRDDSDKQKGMAAFATINEQAYDPKSALAALESMKGLTPGAKMFALQQLNGTWGNIYQPEQLAGMAGFTGSSGGGGLNGDYAQMLVTLESGGNAGATNSRSSATGLHQFTEGTWLGTIKKAKPAWAAGMSDRELLALRTDPKISSQVEVALRADNTRALRNAGLPVNNANLYAMHHFGSTKFAAASDDTPISQILSPAQIAANPYVRGKTKGEVIANWAARTGGGSPASVGRGAALRLGQERAGRSSASELLTAAVEGSNNPREVVAELRQGPFQGTDAGFLTRRLNQIVTESKVNGRATITYGQAGVILKDALRENEGNGKFSMTDPTTWNFGLPGPVTGKSVRVNKNGDRLNESYIENEIARGKAGTLIDDAAREDDIRSGVATLAQAQARASAARTEYQRVAELAVTRPGLAKNLPQLRARMDAANAAVQMAAGSAETTASPIRAPIATSSGQPTGGGFWDMFKVRRD